MFIGNNFKSLEQRYHDEEMKVALKSAKASSTAAIIAFISLLVSAGFGIYQACSPQKIAKEQINAIETAIRNNHIEEPFEVEIRDSVLVKPNQSIVSNPRKK